MIGDPKAPPSDKLLKAVRKSEAALAASDAADAAANAAESAWKRSVNAAIKLAREEGGCGVGRGGYLEGEWFRLYQAARLHVSAEINAARDSQKRADAAIDMPGVVS